MKDLTWQWSWTMALPMEKLWDAVADTDTFNEKVGLPVVAFKTTAPGRREGRFRILGMDVSWDEFPFEFEAPTRLSVLRRYHGGPLEEMSSSISLAPGAEAGTTILTHTVRARPRHFLGAWIAHVQIGFLTKRGFDRVYRAMERNLVAGRTAYVKQPAIGPALGKTLRRSLEGVEQAELLVSYLTTGDAADLTRMRPFHLAKQWDLPRTDALRLCLQATRAGVLDASWVLVCPHCRGPQESAHHLKDLDFDVFCESCNLDFSADFDLLTELTFSLSAQWKELDVPVYCIGGPGRTPHVTAQWRIGPGTSAAFVLNLAPGAYRLRTAVGTWTVYADVAGDHAAGDLQVELGAPHEAISVNPHLSLQISNPFDTEQTVLLERTAWADEACPASYVTAQQDFRDLFPDEVLAPDLTVKIGHVAILFTDLKDSTALYQRSGDAPAFKLVRQHFDLLTEAVRQYEGAVVKTIGDAVMAVFNRPEQALNAAVAMHQTLKALSTPDGQPVILKTGLYSGPCFAVTLSDRLDYFGSTVNLAARMQNESQGGDIIVDADWLASLPEGELDGAFQPETFTAHLKGISDHRRLVRLWPAPSVSSAGLTPPYSR